MFYEPSDVIIILRSSRRYYSCNFSIIVSLRRSSAIYIKRACKYFLRNYLSCDNMFRKTDDRGRSIEPLSKVICIIDLFTYRYAISIAFKSLVNYYSHDLINLERYFERERKRMAVKYFRQNYQCKIPKTLITNTGIIAALDFSTCTRDLDTYDLCARYSVFCICTYVSSRFSGKIGVERFTRTLVHLRS